MTKRIKKSNLFRNIFFTNDSILISVRLENKRSRKKFINKYVNFKLQEDK